MSEQTGALIRITGIVQGVGFRPFVYGLANRIGLMGWVRNTSGGVEIRVDGSPAQLDDFIQQLRTEAPPLARIDSLDSEISAPDSFERFEIIPSEQTPAAFQPVSPDMSICPDCLRELFDPEDRRYRYPFINCTNCGPRFTIIADLPYDRPLTTMADFPLCPECAAEYENPLDRRFHAQPVACAECGPQLWFERSGQSITARRDEIPLTQEVCLGEAGLAMAQTFLAQGQIVAVKGLGGFHLACDATNPLAVAALRERKLRVDKPFAVMMADMDTVRQACLVSPAEQAVLEFTPAPDRDLAAQAGCSRCFRGGTWTGYHWGYVAVHSPALPAAVRLPQKERPGYPTHVGNDLREFIRRADRLHQSFRPGTTIPTGGRFLDAQPADPGPLR